MEQNESPTPRNPLENASRQGQEEPRHRRMLRYILPLQEWNDLSQEERERITNRARNLGDLAADSRLFKELKSIERFMTSSARVAGGGVLTVFGLAGLILAGGVVLSQKLGKYLGKKWVLSDPHVKTGFNAAFNLFGYKSVA